MVHLFFPEGVNMGFPDEYLLSHGSRKVLKKNLVRKLPWKFIFIYLRFTRVEQICTNDTMTHFGMMTRIWQVGVKLILYAQFTSNGLNPSWRSPWTQRVRYKQRTPQSNRGLILTSHYAIVDTHLYLQCCCGEYLLYLGNFAIGIIRKYFRLRTTLRYASMKDTVANLVAESRLRCWKWYLAQHKLKIQFDAITC